MSELLVLVLAQTIAGERRKKGLSYNLGIDCCSIRFAMKESPELRLAIEKRWGKNPSDQASFELVFSFSNI